MKKILIGLVAMLLSNCAISQTSPTQRKLSYSIPDKAKKRGGAKDPNAKPLRKQGMIRLADTKNGVFYETDKVNFFVRADDSANKPDYLTVMRESMLLDSIYGNIKWTFEDIQELNNLIYLKGVCKYTNDPGNYVTILAVNKTYTLQMVAYIEYDEKDKEAGEKAVKDFLKSAKFR